MRTGSSFTRRSTREFARMRRRTFAPAPEVTRGRGLLRTTGVIAVIYALADVIGMLAQVIGKLAGASVEVAMPVATFWPSLKPSVVIEQGPTASVAGGGFDNATVSVKGLDFAARAWLAGGDALIGATFLAIAIVIAMLCFELLGGKPFGGILPRIMSIAATAILIGGLGWQVCYAIGGNMASQQVLTVTGWSIADKDVAAGVSETGWPAPTQDFTVSLWPVLIALALAAVGIAFRYGGQVQRDRERAQLVAERLRRDTEGLV